MEKIDAFSRLFSSSDIFCTLRYNIHKYYVNCIVVCLLFHKEIVRSHRSMYAYYFVTFHDFV